MKTYFLLLIVKPQFQTLLLQLLKLMVLHPPTQVMIFFVTPITIQDESIACSDSVTDPIPIQVSSLHSDSSPAAFDSTDSSVPTFVTSVLASTSTNEPPLVPIRRSSRQSTKPVYLQDYVCATNVSSAPYDVADGLTYSHLEPCYQSYLLAVSTSP